MIQQTAANDPQPLADTRWLEELVLARLVYDPRFAASRLDMLCITCEEGGRKPEVCEDFSTPIHTACFQALRVYLKMVGLTGQPVQYEYFAQCLQSLSNASQFVRESEIPQVLQLMGQVQMLNWQASASAIDALMPVWIKDRRTKWITNDFVVQGRSGSWLAKRLEFELRIIDRWLSGLGEETMQGFGYGLDNPKPDVPRIRTRLPHYDRVTGGGVGKGEGTLIIAATGVGKTALGIQFCMDFVGLSRQKGLFISTEEPNDRIEKRMVSNFCTIPIGKLINGARPDSFGPIQAEAYFRMRAQINSDNLQVYSWPKDGARSIGAGLEDDIKRAADRMGGLDFVILDWVGGALGAAEEDPAKVRLRYQNAADKMAEIAATMNIATISFAAAHPEKGVNRKLVSSAQLSECKTMGRYMLVIVGISGMLNEEATMEANGSPIYKNQQHLFISKARYGEGGLIQVHRKMEFQQMLDSANAR